MNRRPFLYATVILLLSVASNAQETSSTTVDDASIKPFEDRLGNAVDAFVNNPKGTPRDQIREYFIKPDLPKLHQSLSNPDYASNWIYIATAICVLEDNHEEAFRQIIDLVSRKIDWKAIKAAHPYGINRETTFRNMYTSISALGFVPTSAATNELIRLLNNREEARKIVSNSSGGALSSSEFGVYATAIQTGAAYGLLHTRDPELFQHVIDYYNSEAKKRANAGHHPLGQLSNNLRRLIEQWDLLIEQGWEEGYDTLNARNPGPY